MEYINGDNLTKIYFQDKQLFKNLLIEAGKIISHIHDINVNHNDLSTSNFIFCKNTKQLYLIDFGLSSLNTSYENNAIDIFMMEKSVLALTGDEEMVNQVFIGYQMYKVPDKELIRKLEEVRLRGRKR